MYSRFKLYFMISFIGLLISACKETLKDRLQTADLVFVSVGASAFDGAIASATSDSLSSYTHVGIIECREDGIYVLEASSKKGVTETPISEFKERDGALSYYRVISGEIDPEQVIENAKSFMGQPYDFLYLPDNGSLYCSELVYESYTDAEGKPIFEAHPMNFRDKDGNMPEFWTNLFKEHNEEIPEGVLGTNPNDLSKSIKLVKLEIE